MSVQKAFATEVTSKFLEDQLNPKFSMHSKDFQPETIVIGKNELVKMEARQMADRQETEQLQGY